MPALDDCHDSQNSAQRLWPPMIILRLSQDSKSRDRFVKKKCGNQTVGAPGLANGEGGAEGTEGVECGERCPLPTGGGV